MWESSFSFYFAYCEASFFNMFFRKMLFFIGIRLNRGKIVDSAFPVLSYVKCISIFHLPPFSIFLSDYHLVNRVEDRVFSLFIFHPLPSLEKLS